MVMEGPESPGDYLNDSCLYCHQLYRDMPAQESTQYAFSVMPLHTHKHNLSDNYSPTIPFKALCAQQHWTVWNSLNTPYCLPPPHPWSSVFSSWNVLPAFVAWWPQIWSLKNPSWHPWSPHTTELPLLLALSLSVPGLPCTLLLLFSLLYLSEWSLTQLCLK